MIRSDKRTPNQIRPIESEQALLNKADGSAKFTQNKSSVLAAVYGPVEVIPRKEKISKANIDVVFTPATGNSSYEDKEKEMLIRNALESVIITSLHPRTQISIIIQVYSDDGSIVSCAINAACLALLDAGIELNSLLGSITLCYNHDGTVCLDPDTVEEELAKGLAIYAFNNQTKLVMVNTTGVISEQQYDDGLRLARMSCETVLAYIRLAVKNRIMGHSNDGNNDAGIEHQSKTVEPMES
ncbi:hypothetical protein SAMD00019534_081600 [Acytostelium subglobosum LB1]|uniref:hypothetical protein n=1 Tax=Acytostelium subglobosum LB1 TaxID=1410327 RepID=UPI000644D2B7|nr:hypothetical protein SAMD00019534_081600 [Acytostelium subglobosum LB1]GAM24985.1 hypothetical protein SAMD00019534_081600 [Acytostelium subglobosum LB1]|eukprot:XP_012752074.1 hypothetical protein SAMD00019534_081600 [Acytostelium subglobosum LB1]